MLKGDQANTIKQDLIKKHDLGAKKLDNILPVIYSLILLQIEKIFVLCTIWMYKYHHDCLQNIFDDFLC